MQLSNLLDISRRLVTLVPAFNWIAAKDFNVIMMSIFHEIGTRNLLSTIWILEMGGNMGVPGITWDSDAYILDSW
jgi:hypothetical protein